MQPGLLLYMNKAAGFSLTRRCPPSSARAGQGGLYFHNAWVRRKLGWARICFWSIGRAWISEDTEEGTVRLRCCREDRRKLARAGDHLPGEGRVDHPCPSQANDPACGLSIPKERQYGTVRWLWSYLQDVARYERLPGAVEDKPRYAEQIARAVACGAKPEV